MAEVEMGLSVYDYNKNIMRQLPVLEDLADVKKKLYEFVENTTSNKYLMLLCKEKADYTLFNFETNCHVEQFVEDVIECMENRGLGFVDISFTPENTHEALEIWVKKPGQMEEANAYYLFNADNLVITY